MPHVQPWADDAACAGHPLPLWDAPDTAGRPTRAVLDRQELAKAICSGCPVAAQCLADANGHDVGSVRGGQVITKEMVGRGEYIPTWPRFPEPHGSPAAARAHYRAGEPLCPICWWEDSRRRVDAQQHAIPA